jgi:5'-nucleotidase
MLEHALDSGSPAAHVAGATVRYDPRRPAGRRIRGVEVGAGRKLRSEAEYTLAIDDFLAAGGDGYAMLAGLPSEPGTMLDVDGVITYLRRLPQPVQFAGRAGFVSTR